MTATKPMSSFSEPPSVSVYLIVHTFLRVHPRRALPPFLLANLPHLNTNSRIPNLPPAPPSAMAATNPRQPSELPSPQQACPILRLLASPSRVLQHRSTPTCFMVTLSWSTLCHIQSHHPPMVVTILPRSSLARLRRCTTPCSSVAEPCSSI